MAHTGADDVANDSATAVNTVGFAVCQHDIRRRGPGTTVLSDITSIIYMCACVDVTIIGEEPAKFIVIVIIRARSSKNSIIAVDAIGGSIIATTLMNVVTVAMVATTAMTAIPLKIIGHIVSIALIVVAVTVMTGLIVTIIRVIEFAERTVTVVAIVMAMQLTVHVGKRDGSLIYTFRHFNQGILQSLHNGNSWHALCMHTKLHRPLTQ